MSNNELQKSKAIWDMDTTKHFIQACLDQVAKQQHNGTTLTNKGWKDVLSQFNEKIGRQYDKSQLKNKWDNLRKEWSVWHQLFGKETGLGSDYTKHIVDAPNEWWERKQLENPLYGKFRYKGLPFKDELTTLFKDVMADGKFAWAPSSGILPSGIEENDDGYRPCFEDAHLDLEEGSGDSDEGIGASVGVSSDFQHINLSSTLENNSQKSTGKRKRAVVCDATEKKKKIKLSASKQIVDAISRIASASESRSIIVNRLVMPGSSIGEVMVEIQHMDAITNNAD